LRTCRSLTAKLAQSVEEMQAIVEMGNRERLY
jgi:hypothetical protein